MSTITASPSSHRIGFRVTPEQDAVLRRAAKVANKTITDFILDSACLVAEETLLDQRLFMVEGEQYASLLELLERPAQVNEGVQDLFSRKAPWDTQS